MKALKSVGFVALLSVSVGLWRAGGQTLTTLYQFGGLPSDGHNPTAPLMQGRDGNFYGTAYGGGTNGAGTVFMITPQGALTTLWQFGSGATNGANPEAGLVQGSDGNFYGTTQNGGTNGAGTAFRISPQGSLTTIWQFGSTATDGNTPRARLVQGSDGNFYGTTEYGGTSTNWGTVFKITPQGTLTTLYEFGDLATGSVLPYAGLVQGNDGNFYGTTYGGVYGVGSVFQITPEGTLTTLDQFSNGAYSGPYGGLVQGIDGNLYGTTAGGATSGGTVFKISSQGTLTTLCQLTGNTYSGPYAGLVQGSDGNFYGTTTGAGTNFEGTVFEVTPKGTLTTPWQFGRGPTNGAMPNAEVVQGCDGNFYGTTWAGGTNGYGTVFRLFVALDPPANQVADFQFLSVFDATYAAFFIPSVAGETYQLQYTDSMNPTNWMNTGVPILSIGGPLTAVDFVEPTTSQRYYRFQITP